MKQATIFFKSFRYLFYSLLLVLGLHTLLRGIFIWYNKDLLAVTGISDIVKIFYSGLQQDLTSILLINLPVVFLVVIYQYVKPKKVYRSSIRWLFIVINSAGLALNLIDIGYFGFIKHRMNVEVAFIIQDSLRSYKAILSEFWLLFFLYVLAVAILIKFSSAFLRIPLRTSSVASTAGRQFVLLIIFLIAMRGFKGKMVHPYNPLTTVKATQLPAAQNSILTIAYSFLKKQHELKPYHFFPDKEVNTIVPVSYYIGDSSLPFKRKNVVLFILESFSRGYLLPGDPYKAKTPFLDSLIGKSIFFPNAFAVNYSSTQGIVPILGSIPTLLDEPFFYSSYANLKIQGIGNALKSKGYNTNFFMGAEKDHFGFGKFSNMVGIDHYYSKEDFNDNRYDDGNWGIFDAPFFNYGANVLNQKQQPFLGVFFNLSSHFPFTLPGELKDRFNDPSQLPSQRAISYVDYALQNFFEKARSSSWFQNSLFVFCADHWFSPDRTKIGYGNINASAISFFIYDPSSASGSANQKLVSQLDVVPTVLDLINYRDVYHGFGKTAFDSTANRYVINKYQDYYYQCISDHYVLGVDPNSFQAKYLFSYSGDSLTSGNLVNADSLRGLRLQQEQYVKAYLQQYTKVLTNRRF